MNPFFSIIIPAYNAEKYIDRAIKSVLDQKFMDYELLIINDGSNDKTANIIEEYAKNNIQIKIINHDKNESLHIVRIDGVSNSNGQYLLFLDSDDYFTNDALNLLEKEIKKNPDYDFYEFGYIKQPSKKAVFPSFKGKDRFSAYFERDIYPAYTMWNKVYNSELIKKAFSYIEREYINNAEDIYESIVIAYFCKKTIISKIKIINYTIGSGVSTIYKDYNKTIEYLNSLKVVLREINLFLIKNNINININNIYYRFLSHAYYYINLQKNIEEKKKLYLILLDYFDAKTIMEFFFNRESLLIQSKEYKIGRFILQLLRKIKSFFR